MRKIDRNPGALEAVTDGWSELFAAHGQTLLDTHLPAWLYRQRWFGAKTRKINKLSILSWVELPTAAVAGAALPAVPEFALDDATRPALFYFEVAYDDGASDVYQVPLAVSGPGSTESIQVHSACWTPHWLNRDMLYVTVDYPFNQLGVNRIFGMVPEDNLHAQEFNIKFGFQYVVRIEGVYKGNIPCMVMSLERGACRYLSVKPRSIRPNYH